MAILENEIWVGLNSQTIKYYLEKGYSIPKIKDINGIERVNRGTKIFVKVKDLPPSSSVRVTKICDLCGEMVETYFNKILKGRINSDEDKCKSCSDKQKLHIYHKNKININCIAKTNPEFSIKFLDQNDAFLYTYQSNKKTDFKCPDCGEIIRNKRIQDVYKYGLSCPNCSDGYSYPEKFMFNLLKQLNIEFEVQKSFKWIKGKRFDFYIKKLNCIIETHGAQHYDGGFFRNEHDNDLIKKSEALKNGIKSYIEIDASRSSIEHMKKSILDNKKLNNILDIANVDFLKCHEFSTKSIVRMVSNLYIQNHSILEIANIMQIERHTVSRYLKKASELGWCNFVPHSGNIIQVVQLSLDGDYLSEFNSIANAERKTGAKNITNACKGRQKTAGGFRWMYKEDYDSKQEE